MDDKKPDKHKHRHRHGMKHARSMPSFEDDGTTVYEETRKLRRRHERSRSRERRHEDKERDRRFYRLKGGRDHRRTTSTGSESDDSAGMLLQYC